jgi:peptide deformylase
MSMSIIIYPNQILREKTQKVEKIDKNIKKLINEMKKIMLQNNGVGLAANQIGVNLSIFVAYDYEKEQFYTFINPNIIKFLGQEKIMDEGCLSIPNKWGQVKRYEGVIIEYEDLFGKKKKLRAKGLLAQIIQHEIDHLNGILFIDKTKNIIDLKK